jgi:hypothetical protein
MVSAREVRCLPSGFSGEHNRARALVFDCHSVVADRRSISMTSATPASLAAAINVARTLEQY